MVFATHRTTLLVVAVTGALLLAPRAAVGLFGSQYEQPYIDAVKAWLADPTPAGAVALVELEAAATGPRLNRVDEAEERIANDLWRLDPEALLPIAALHRVAYEIHLARGAEIPARHSAQRLRDVVDLFARHSKTTAARAAAARQWCHLGLSLLARSGSYLSPATACLAEALGHARSRRHETDELRRVRVRALHIRAVVMERLGVPTKALDDLRDLLELDPDHREARLREAVNRVHAGDTEDAEPTLRELAALREPEWIGIVANQQLARLLIDEDRVEEARGQLRTAVERFPGNARLGVLLAYYERPSWRQASRRVEGLLESWRSTPPLRPRSRYEVPLDDDRAIRLAAQQDLEARLDAARQAIAELEAKRAAR